MLFPQGWINIQQSAATARHLNVIIVLSPRRRKNLPSFSLRATFFWLSLGLPSRSFAVILLWICSTGPWYRQFNSPLQLTVQHNFKFRRLNISLCTRAGNHKKRATKFRLSLLRCRRHCIKLRICYFLFLCPQQIADKFFGQVTLIPSQDDIFPNCGQISISREK
jgi:hypothetical protein